MRKLLHSYKTPTNESPVIAEINGKASSEDHDALISLAKQLNIFTSSDDFSSNVDALQTHFQA